MRQENRENGGLRISGDKDWGDKGYMYMMDEWFDQYLFEIIVSKKYLSLELLNVLRTEPVVLPPWDPMGTLAG
jgi:bleomycin hydrolase